MPVRRMPERLDTLSFVSYIASPFETPTRGAFLLMKSQLRRLIQNYLIEDKKMNGKGRKPRARTRIESRRDSASANKNEKIEISTLLTFPVGLQIA